MVFFALSHNLVQSHISLAEQHLEAGGGVVDGFDALPVFGGVAGASRLNRTYPAESEGKDMLFGSPWESSHSK